MNFQTYFIFENRSINFLILFVFILWKINTSLLSLLQNQNSIIKSIKLLTPFVNIFL